MFTLYLPSNAPPRATRKHCAELLTDAGFPISARSLERWDNVGAFLVNGKITVDVPAVFARAQRTVDTTPQRPGRGIPQSRAAGVARG